MIELKITKTVAEAYFAHDMKGFPMTAGMHTVDEETAIRMRADAYEMVSDAKNPTVRAAFSGLFRQLDKGLMMGEKTSDVSQRNNEETGRFVVVDRAQLVTLEQVRTTFDDESLGELAADIKKNGLINPVTVRPGMQDEKWILIAGERRVRACELAGVPIVAMVLDVDAPAARRIQLAENVHREDLSLQDKARAVRDLYDELGTMQAVADTVKKSKGWVSKHVAVTEPDFGWRTSALLHDGLCEDLELLGTISKIEKSCTWADANEAVARLKEGKLNREDAREFLRSRSEKVAADRKIRDEDDKRKETERQAQIDARKTKRADEGQGNEGHRDAPVFLSPAQALKNLVKYYATFRDQEYDGDMLSVATEVSNIPFIGEGCGESYRAFTNDEIKKAWTDAIDSLAEWGDSMMTEEYFQDLV